jgi:hypothetical protein
MTSHTSRTGEDPEIAAREPVSPGSGVGLVDSPRCWPRDVRHTLWRPSGEPPPGAPDARWGHVD